MYESVTYEVILQRMLARIPDTYDKREGSIIYDALAPAAADLAQMYIELDATRDLTFVQTSAGEYLDDLVGEFGLTRIPASKAIVKGSFNIDIPISSRFSGDTLNYVATEKISTGVYYLECETAGSAGNNYTGRLIPITYISGLTSATITEISIPARDTETDAELKARYYEQINGGPADGNVAQYEKWASTYDGIGRFKVFSLWNGANTVKVSILDENNDIASATLISNFQAYLDPSSTGLGNGAAPIGAIVTVSTASAKSISIALKVELAAGYTTATEIVEALKAFFHSISYVKTVVNYFSVVAAIMGCQSVADIISLTVNSGTSDISMTSEEIPVLTSWVIRDSDNNIISEEA